MIESVYPAFGKRISTLFHLVRWLLPALFLPFMQASAQNIEVRLTWSAQPKTFDLITGKSVTQPTFLHAAQSQKYDFLPSFSQFSPATTGGNVTVQVLN